MCCPVHCVCPNLHTASAWSTGCMLVQAFLLDLVCIMFRTVGAGRQPGAFLPPQDSSLSPSLPFRSRNLSSIRLSSSLSTHVLGPSPNQPRTSPSTPHQTLSPSFLHTIITSSSTHHLKAYLPLHSQKRRTKTTPSINSKLIPKKINENWKLRKKKEKKKINKAHRSPSDVLA